MSKLTLPAEQENDLDQYLTQDAAGWSEHFLTEQARRAPWWTISFLVHCLVIVVMWRMPAQVQALVPRNDIVVDMNFIPDDPVEPFTDDDLVLPEFELDPKIEPIADVEIQEPPGEDHRLGDPTEPELTPWVQDVTDNADPTIETISFTKVFEVERPGPGPRRDGFKHRRTGWGRRTGKDTGVPPGLIPLIEPGLIWLAKAQERDGRWSCRNWEGAGDHDAGMTGLALLAFLGRGHTHLRGKYKTTISRGLTWLATNQKANGSFGWTTFYEQGIAAMAVSEAYGMTRQARLGRMAQAAVDYIIAEQPEHGGFRYRGGTTKREGDTSVTGWQVMAIKSALLADLRVPDSAVERSRTFLNNVRRDYGQSSYLVGEDRSGPSVSAIAMSCRQYIGGEGTESDVRASADYLLKHSTPGKGKDRLVGDLYYTYYSTLAMFQMGGEYWYRWNKAFFRPLAAGQIRDKRFDSRGRSLTGSWDPANHAWGARGGRVYTTAMAILCLEVYHRFTPMYRWKA